jgi:hypothetical protein
MESSDVIRYGEALPCPRCGEHSLSHCEATFYGRRADSPYVREVRMIAGGPATTMFVPTGMSRNSGKERGGLAVAFRCERCPAEIELTFRQEDNGSADQDWRLVQISGDLGAEPDF